MSALFKQVSGGDRSPAPLVAALVLAALVPTVGVLWFMSVAMRNERLAVQAQLADVYSNQLVALQRRVGDFWKERQAALQAVAAGSAAEKFAAVVRANLAESVVVNDGAGKPLYPGPSTLEARVQENAEWTVARELEFQKKDYAAAAGAYARLAESSQDIHAQARALQSQSGCLFKAGQRLAAFVPLTQVAADSSLRKAISLQGTLIAPNAQLQILKLLAEDESSESLRALRAETFSRLVEWLNDYSTTEMAASQRMFLMQEVKLLASNSVTFSTLAAEEMAAAFLESNQGKSSEGAAPSAPISKRGADGAAPSDVGSPGVWQISASDRTVVALYREERVKAEVTTLLDSLVLPDVRVTLLAPGETFDASRLVPPLEAGQFLPGWRLGLSFKGADPLAVASARQARFYLWIGSLVVLIIAVLAWFVARYVSAQMKLARLKNELVSTVSHELKTPLASMRAMVDTLAARRYRDDAQLHDYLDLIAKENLRLSGLIENFLTFSRLERGQDHLRLEGVAPERVVAHAVDALKEKLGAADCRFEKNVAPNLPLMRGDADALSTVLINLLDNAHKYSDGEKRIAVRAYSTGDHVCFEVADNGIGFEPAEAKRIFDRFYQIDQSLTRKRGGCGLGLAIVNSIVRAHGGAMEVESEPGKGSTFRVMIPVAKMDSVSAVDPTSELKPVDHGLRG